MAEKRVIDPNESVYARFAYELWCHRRRAGLPQTKFGHLIGYSPSLVQMVENVNRIPTETFASACDRVLNTTLFSELVQEMRAEQLPQHFRDFATEEWRATGQRTWDPLLIPGLFQTESYARRVISSAPGVTPEQVEHQIQNRMKRRAIISREDSATVLSLIDEGVLHRPMGDAPMMREQLEHLLEAGHHPQVMIQVVPFSAWTAAGMQSHFTILERAGRPYTVYVEGTPEGRLVGERNMVVQIIRRHDALRAVAHTKDQSLEIIKEVIGRWT